MLLLAALGAGAGCTCSSDGTRAGQGGGGEDAALGAGGSFAGSGGASGIRDARDSPSESSACSSPPGSKAIPNGWVRFPGLPCKCDLWVAPTADQMGPPPVWTQRPSGVLELENDWADYPHRILTGSALGDSHGGQPIITYGRDLGQIAGRFVHEWIVMKLPSNEILFRARQPGGDSASCVLYPSALGQGSVLYHAFETVSGIAPRQWVLAGGPAEDAVPDFIYGATDASNGVEFVLGRGIALSATHVCFMVPTDDSSEITR